MGEEEKLNDVDLERAAENILGAHYVMALTGAGMSVESNIPPFRGPGGIWTKYGEPPMDGYQRFMRDPKKAWEETMNPKGPYAGLREALEQAIPNPGHLALAELENMGVLKTVITQNVDNLHLAAGSKNVLEIHGNVKLLRCMSCNTRYRREEVSLDVLPPQCSQCSGTLKTDMVMFGEPIPMDVLRSCQEETLKCDCMLVLGTSATVYPAASFPQDVRGRGFPLIEVNLYESEITPMCRISLRGTTGEVLPRLVEEIKKGRT
jgi:NAD-dependent deacetylase